MAGDHETEAGPLKRTKPMRLGLPVDFPEFMLNRHSVGMFNTLYFNKQRGKIKSGLVDYEPFFYPLDRLHQWNRMYGRNGLLQFQCVLGWEARHTGLIEILKAITSSGLASFLAVLKVFGDMPSPGMMSFPRPGITLALDFPIRRNASFDLLELLGAITLDHGGRMYPAKDATMTPAQFQAAYPQWKKFATYIDPAFDSAFWQRVTA
jgi:FAD/FMN-containing dehydrogenase